MVWPSQDGDDQQRECRHSRLRTLQNLPDHLMALDDRAPVAHQGRNLGVEGGPVGVLGRSGGAWPVSSIWPWGPTALSPAKIFTMLRRVPFRFPR